MRIAPFGLAVAASLGATATVAQEVWSCVGTEECRTDGAAKSCEVGRFVFDFVISPDGARASTTLPEEELTLPLVSSAAEARRFEADVDGSRFVITLARSGAMQAVRINRYTHEMMATCTLAEHQ